MRDDADLLSAQYGFWFICSGFPSDAHKQAYLMIYAG